MKDWRYRPNERRFVGKCGRQPDMNRAGCRILELVLIMHHEGAQPVFDLILIGGVPLKRDRANVRVVGKRPQEATIFDLQPLHLIMRPAGQRWFRGGGFLRWPLW